MALESNQPAKVVDTELWDVTGRIIEAIWTAEIKTMGMPFVSRSEMEGVQWKVTYTTNHVQEEQSKLVENIRLMDELANVLRKAGYDLMEVKSDRFRSMGIEVTAVSGWFNKQ